MRRLVTRFLAYLSISGCASTQLNYNTLDLAASLNTLTDRQIFFNLSKTVEDHYAVPSQVSITSGTAQTTNIINPSLSLPFGTSSVVTNSLVNTGMNSVANAVAGTATNTVTNTLGASTTNTGTASTVTSGTGTVMSTTSMGSTAIANTTSSAIANGTTNGTTNTVTNGNQLAATNSTAVTHPQRSLSLSYTDNWLQSWTLNPATDPDELRRLRALYRYALGYTDVAAPDLTGKSPVEVKTALKDYSERIKKAFICEYPIQSATPSPAGLKSAAEARSAKITASNANAKADLAEAAYAQDQASLEAANQAQAAVAPLKEKAESASSRRFVDVVSKNLAGALKAYSDRLKESADKLEKRRIEQVAADTSAKAAEAIASVSRRVQPLGFTCDSDDADEPPYQVQMQADVAFLRMPSCVICEVDPPAAAAADTMQATPTDDPSARPANKPKSPDDQPVQARVNPNLKFGFLKTQGGPGLELLQSYGHVDFYICAKREVCYDKGSKDFHEFVMFVHEATGQSSATGAVSKKLTPATFTVTGSVATAD